jgi:hypothetical protein
VRLGNGKEAKEDAIQSKGTHLRECKRTESRGDKQAAVAA